MNSFTGATTACLSFAMCAVAKSDAALTAGSLKQVQLSSPYVTSKLICLSAANTLTTDMHCACLLIPNNGVCSGET